MPLITEQISNLINGVSQQPPSLRLASQCETQENGLVTILDPAPSKIVPKNYYDYIDIYTKQVTWSSLKSK